MKRWLKLLIIGIVCLFAFIGLAFTGVYVAMQFGLLNVRGSIIERNAFFFSATTDATTSAAVATVRAQPCVDESKYVCVWNQTPEWAVVAGGLEKDAAIIARVSRETGVPERLIVAAVIPEQVRFFTANREVFKRYFEPLKILGSLSQFSLGVSGIKQETAEKIEEYARDATSPFYPGPSYAALIEYPAGVDQSKELYNRLTDADDHYYSYLYTALYIKEITAQWERAGFPIDDNPEAVVTLFNIGFQNSNPNANPKAAGAAISTGGQSYPFGVLGGMFYRSNELTALFPR